MTLAVAVFLLAAGKSRAAERITAAELRAATYSGGIIDNAAFVPSGHAKAAREPFFGTLELTESRMISTPDKISPNLVLGRDPQLFPGVDLAFFTDGGDLVPFTQDVIRFASIDRGKSFWDIIVQPGRVWSEAADGGWSRAAFPLRPRQFHRRRNAQWARNLPLSRVRGVEPTFSDRSANRTFLHQERLCCRGARARRARSCLEG